MSRPILTYYNMSPRVTAFSTTRHGGHSRGAYAEFNINRYCGDDEDCVKLNTDALCCELKINRSQLVMPHQTHDTETRLIAADFLTLPDKVRDMILDGTDALITDVKGVCIGVSTADCIPILLYDADHHAAAAIHAGWRGTLKRIATKAVHSMNISYGTRPEALKAVIGPGISLDAFEVGDEVYDEFASSGFDMSNISVRKNKWHIDLKECNRRQLNALGIPDSNIYVSPICTYNSADDYFSARRLGTMSGRIFTAIMLI